MNKIKIAALILLTGAAAGCSGQFWGGTASGVVGAGAGYEYRANEEMKRIESAHSSGQMNDAEYETRKDQIQRMSVLK